MENLWPGRASRRPKGASFPVQLRAGAPSLSECLRRTLDAMAAPAAPPMPTRVPTTPPYAPVASDAAFIAVSTAPADDGAAVRLGSSASGASCADCTGSVPPPEAIAGRARPRSGAAVDGLAFLDFPISPASGAGCAALRPALSRTAGAEA